MERQSEVTRALSKGADRPFANIAETCPLTWTEAVLNRHAVAVILKIVNRHRPYSTRAEN